MKFADIVGASVIWLGAVVIWTGVYLDKLILKKTEKQLEEIGALLEQAKKIPKDGADYWKEP